MRLLVRQFLQLESSSGIILILMTLIAIAWANSPLAFLHQKFIATWLFWINEGLMAIFFLLVGLELKQGLLYGELSKPRQIVLPLVSALGGMAVPALIYYFINQDNPITLKGWATPVATDIAFALGVLSLFGKRISIELKLFLLALAIFDDIGAIVIIAFFYSHGISVLAILAVIGLLTLLYIGNLFSVRSLTFYLVLGVLLWLCLLPSGIHPTLAGILLAFTIPADPVGNSPVTQLENKLHPYVAYLIMPLFALANAGFSLQLISIERLSAPIVLGIILGLFMGKQLGIFGTAWICIKLGLAKLPKQASWFSLYGVSLLCGIGFTMSLFLVTLSFQP